MSKHHISHSQQRMLNDVQRLGKEQLIELYGIEVSEDGTVFDPTENRKFDDLKEWAMYIGEQDDDDNYGTFSKITSPPAYDDEY